MTIRRPMRHKRQYRAAISVSDGTTLRLVRELVLDRFSRENQESKGKGSDGVKPHCFRFRHQSECGGGLAGGVMISGTVFWLLISHNSHLYMDSHAVCPKKLEQYGSPIKSSAAQTTPPLRLRRRWYSRPSCITWSISSSYSMPPQGAITEAAGRRNAGLAFASMI